MKPSPTPSLLRRALTRVNARGPVLTWPIVVIGALLAAVQFSAAPMLLHRGMTVLPQVIGEGPTNQLKDTLDRARLGTNDHNLFVEQLFTAIDAKEQTLSDDEKPAFQDKIEGALVSLSGWIALFAVLLLLAQIAIRTVTLVAAADSPNGQKLLARSLAIAPRLIGVWIVLWIVTGTWISVILAVIASFVPVLIPALGVAAFAIPLLVYPRFALASAILVTEKSTIIGAVRTSYTQTRKRYGKMLSALIGVYVTIFLVSWLAQTLVGGMIDLASARSAYASLITLVLPFVSVMLIAYRSAFAVELNEECRM